MASTILLDIKNPVVNIISDNTNGHNSTCRLLQTTVEDKRVILHFDSVEELDRYIHGLVEARQIRG
jgi:hypothetical protein